MLLTWVLLMTVTTKAWIAEANDDRSDDIVNMAMKRLITKALPELKQQVSRQPPTDNLHGRQKRLSRKGRQFLIKRQQSLPSSCTAEYQELDESTMCNYWDDPGVINSGVSDVDIEVILDVHNYFRSGVYPTATNMVKMYYDENIAVIAQKYANVCPDDHDTNDERAVPNYGINVGQNLAWGYASWEAAMVAWHDEVDIYHYGEIVNYLEPGEMIGHYTQMVNADAIRIGCGYAECPATWQGYEYHWTTYVCNYAYGQSNMSFPYDEGDSCDSCDDFCDNGLCDCGDLLCRNGGHLDLETCECVCADTYTGVDCQELDCPDYDAWYCETQWPPSYCEMYTNVPEECPIMCGICGAVCPGMGADFCQNGGSLNTGTCTCDCPEGRTGDQCELYESCPVDSDAWYCGTYWPEFYCTIYSNVPDVCPYMCGIC